MLHAVAADLVERLDQFRPGDGGLPVVDVNHLQLDQAVESLGVVDESLRFGQRHGLGFLGGPGTDDRRFQAEHVAEILALLPGAEHFPDVRDVVSAVEHRGDQPQPGQMGVVEQRDAARPAAAAAASPGRGRPGCCGWWCRPAGPGLRCGIRRSPGAVGWRTAASNSCDTAFSMTSRDWRRTRLGTRRRFARTPAMVPVSARGGRSGAIAQADELDAARPRVRPRRSRRTGNPASVEDTGWRTPGTSTR